MDKKIVLTGAILILLSIVLGAFGAHGLKKIIDEYGLEIFEKGTQYQMYIGISLLTVGLSADKLDFDLKWFYRLSTLGIIIFAGFLYLLSFKSIIPEVKIAGAIVPIGGSLMIIAWCVFIFKLIKSKQ